jgi:agmatinase
VRVNRSHEPPYAGVGTFAKLPLALSPEELAGFDVAVVGAPTDDAVSNRPGARYGPRAIRLADPSGGSPPSRPNMDVGIDPFGALAVVDYGDAEAVQADKERTHAAIRHTVSEVVEAGLVPIVLGGDHSIAHPDVGAVSQRVGAASLGLVHFDAHADDAESVHGVRLSHGTPLRLLVEEGSLLGTNIVQVGLRGYWPDPEDFDWARERGFRWHLMEDIVDRGIRPVMDDVVASMAGVRHVFLSVDIDVCDPAFAPGTGTPEPGGLTPRELLRAVRRVAAELPLAGMEVVEVAPLYDVSEITSLLAQRVVLEVLSGMALRKTGRSAERERGAGATG